MYPDPGHSWSVTAGSTRPRSALAPLAPHRQSCRHKRRPRTHPTSLDPQDHTDPQAHRLLPLLHLRPHRRNHRRRGHSRRGMVAGKSCLQKGLVTPLPRDHHLPRRRTHPGEARQAAVALAKPYPRIAPARRGDSWEPPSAHSSPNRAPQPTKRCRPARSSGQRNLARTAHKRGESAFE